MATGATYKVSVPNTEHWQAQIKCQTACPVHTDARGYVRAIAEGDFEKAYLIARGPNPLASICGRICGAPCEVNCRRGTLDKPVSIRALKRYSCESAGNGNLTEELHLIERIKNTFGTLACAGGEEFGFLASLFEGGHFERVPGKRVAIIGSGPAGLAAAHDLALFGFKPVLLETEPVPAGMLYLGVPEYRLPRALIMAEVAAIKAMGVEIKTDVTVGRDVSLPELMKGFASVIIAVGAKKSRPIPVRGAEGLGVYGGVDFLRGVSLRRPMAIGKNVVVIGGGNVAFDVSRTALRHEVQSDVSRTALRHEGVKNVHLCCLESRDEMLATELEVMEGAEEGVILHNSIGPDEILLDNNGAVKAVRFKKVISILDDKGRFAPVFDETDTLEIEADTVLVAIGQQSDFAFVDPIRDGVEVTERGTLVLDEARATTREGLFVAGDAEHGPRLMIDAIASGKRAARTVYKHVMGTAISWDERGLHFPLPNYSRRPYFEVAPRQSLDTEDPILRTRSLSLEIERCFAPRKANEEAERCLDCGVNTIFDGAKCILCSGCVDVCPEQCLKLVSLDELKGDLGFTALRNGFEASGVGRSSGIIKNDDRCTRCALCAERCPVGAITMERFEFSPVCNGRRSHE